jgi:hypothetical protein
MITLIQSQSRREVLVQGFESIFDCQFPQNFILSNLKYEENHNNLHFYGSNLAHGKPCPVVIVVV